MKMTLKFTEMTRRKFTSKFKTKVALEAIKERESLSILAQKHELLPQQITNWKGELLSGADSIFEGKSKSKKTEAQEKEDDLLNIIGQQKVEIEFLKKSLS
jgi:transposase